MCRNHKKAFSPWAARTGLWLLILLFFSSAAQGSSTLNFPRLSFEAGTLTSLAIVNPNDQSAEVTLTAYNADGSILGVNQDPIIIAANSQFAGLVSGPTGIFSGEPDTVAWFQATSTTDNLTGFFLFFNDSLPFNLFDGADLPQTGTSIIFPQVRVDSGYTTEVKGQAVVKEQEQSGSDHHCRQFPVCRSALGPHGHL